MGIYGWMIAALAALLLGIIVLALIQAGTGIDPDEEARILAEERRRRELEKEARNRANTGRKVHRGR